MLFCIVVATISSQPALANLQPWMETTGGVADGSLGWALAAGFDFNHDGYPDVAAGAPRSDFQSTDAGRVYIFFGGPAMDAVADLVLEGANGEQLGWSVAAAGDLDADGFDDLIVGANASDAGGNGAGRAYVFLGGPDVDAMADLVMEGEAAGDELGRWVAGGLDWNGDGHDDAVIGAPFHDFTAENAGRAYVLLGGPGFDTQSDYVFDGEEAFDEYGRSVAWMPDLTGPGSIDLVIAAPGDGASEPLGGVVYVYAGGAGADTVAEARLSGSGQFADGFGWIVASAGDLDRDGRQDLAVGEPFHDQPGLNAGRVWVFAGGGLDQPPIAVLGAESTGDEYGRALAGVGDVSGDGVDDLLVGAHRRRVGGSNAGRLYVYHGGFSFDAQADQILDGEPGRRLGFSVTATDDLSGDGRSDVVVGSPGAKGRVSFLTGSGSDVSAPVVLGSARRKGDQVEVTWSLSSAAVAVAWVRIVRTVEGEPRSVVEQWRGVHADGTWTDFQPSDRASTYEVHLMVSANWLSTGPLVVAPLSGLPPWRPFPSPFRHNLFLPRNGSAAFAVQILDARGRRVRGLGPGVSWDGRDAGGRVVAPGLYHVRPQGRGAPGPVSVIKLP